VSRALITGITGQDGSYLAELLLEKGYEVHGLVHGSADRPFERLEPIADRLSLYPGDLLDESSLVDVLRQSQPDEVYNLAAMSSVAESWRLAVATAEYTAVGVTRLLEGIREVCPEARFYQASSSEMFGRARETPQSESTPFYPRSPYGVAKSYGHFIAVNYRESFGMYACSGILFNHESPRRGESFVTRRISQGAAKIKLVLGNLEAQRDWGYAKEYVEAMWLMLQRERPDDFVIGTGVAHSVRDFVEAAFACLDLKAEDHVRFDPERARPADIEEVVADPGKAKRELGWEAQTGFEQLVELMVRADLEALKACGDSLGSAQRPPAPGDRGIGAPLQALGDRHLRRQLRGALPPLRRCQARLDQGDVGAGPEELLVAQDDVGVAAPAAATGPLVRDRLAHLDRAGPGLLGQIEVEWARGVPPEPVQEQRPELRLVEAQHPRIADLVALQAVLGRQGHDAAGLQHPVHLLDATADVGELAEVLDRARREDRVEGLVLELEPPGVHVADGEPLGVPRPLPVAAGVDQHLRTRVRPRPGVVGLVEIGGYHLTDVTSEPVDGRLMPRSHPQHPSVGAEGAERPECAQGHGDLPVLPVLAAAGEVCAEVLPVGRVDVADQLGELGIGEIGDLAELAVTELAGRHRGTVLRRQWG
jgi:GDPmannose 4,6-dehydratase